MTDNTAAANATLAALRAIPEREFSEAVAKALIAAISARIGACQWSHVQTHFVDAPGAVEFLDDAISVLGGPND